MLSSRRFVHTTKLKHPVCTNCSLPATVGLRYKLVDISTSKGGIKDD